MKIRRVLLAVLLSNVVHAAEGIRWEPWSAEAFARAKKENRLLILDLEAVWCHWCHVMEKTTYADPRVIKTIGERYVALRVDQDARPDISSRYEDYGWPATILFAPDGKEIGKFRGYIPPDLMASRLDAFAKDPTPGPSLEADAEYQPVAQGSLPDSEKKALKKLILDRYDTKLGGWKGTHKLAEWYLAEYLLENARRGDKDAEKKLKQTLKAQAALIDPVWGGVYQYSTDSDWKHVHFEKIMTFQAENLRTYALAYAAYGDAAYKKNAQAIDGFLKEFLTSPEGAFYVSQDADVKPGEHSEGYFKLGNQERRAQGIPVIDKHRYARENGWAIRALAAWYAASGDASVLERAVRAAEWIQKERSLRGGGFRHDEKDAAGPFFADTLTMGDAFLSLYTVTGDRRWFSAADEAAQFLQKNFRAKTAGFHTAVMDKSAVFEPKIQVDENIQMGRFGNLLHQYSGKKEHREMAEWAMRYIASPTVAEHSFVAAGVLLADMELASAPVHVTVVGGKGDPEAKQLFQAAIHYPSQFKRIDWWDPKEGALPFAETKYPQLKRAAAFACSGTRCSLPAFAAPEIAVRIEKLRGVRK